MRHDRLSLKFFGLFLGGVLVGSLPAQGAEVATGISAKCGAPKEPIGYLPHGTGSVIVNVGKDGKPANQMRVLQVTNPSATNALGNLLGSCEFIPGRHLGVPVPMYIHSAMSISPMVVH